MAKWQIGRHVPKCATCEKEFGAGERLYSMLAVGEDGLERRDLCLECYSDDAVAGALFWWRTRHLVEESRGLKLDLEAIEALFLALDPDRVPQAEPETEAESADEEDVVSQTGPVSERLLELRYLMCLILLRKRRVKVLKVARRHNGIEGEFFIVKRPRRQEEIAVQVFDFDADKIAAVRADLQRVFEGADPAELEANEGEEAVVEAGSTGADPDEPAESQ
jgi:hypothetical protein